ncbi:hypothetical protein R3I94_017866 [Phoxinus phoxinus]
MNITNTDSGVYELKIISSSSIRGNIFKVTIHGASAAERDEVKRESVKEGESVTLDPGVIKNTNDVMMWYFNDIVIAKITGDQSQICTDVQCEERFKDRLKLDHQTGFLTITHTRNTDSGLYKLLINIINSSFGITRVKRFSVSVIGSGRSPAAVAGICVVVLLVSAAAAVIYYRHKMYTQVPQNEDDADNPPPNPHDIQEDDDDNPPADPNDIQEDDADNPPHDPNDIQEDDDDNPPADPNDIQEDDANNPPPNPHDIPLEDMEHPDSGRGSQ